MYDVIIIGAGVIGCSVARELSKYNAKILVIEKNEDVCSGTSKANSAIVHSGYDAPNGSLKAKFNVQGNRMMEAVCRELDVPFIVARGRKGGSNVAAAICNALLYLASGNVRE